MKKKEHSGEQKKDEVIIILEGADKQTVLEKLDWVVRGGYVYERNGSQVVSRLDQKPVKLKQVKAVVPGSRILISDILDLEAYTSESQ